MEDERKRLESLGYSFDVKEEPVTEPESKFDVYFRVTIQHHGLVLGTRSEITQEKALTRAFKFAEKHSRGEDPRSLLV